MVKIGLSSAMTRLRSESLTLKRASDIDVQANKSSVYFVGTRAFSSSRLVRRC
jgi:hypothetical protein